MDGTRPREPLTDSALDREIEGAVGIEPSPEFLARVRTRLANEPEAAPWRLGVVSAIRRTSMEPLWGVAIVGIVLTIVVPQVMREERAQPRVAVNVPETTTGVADTTDAVGPSRRHVEVDPIRPAVAATGTDAVHTLPLQLSPVLFAEEDRAAFALFMTAVSDGRVPEKVVQALGEEDVTPIAIAPLVIDPLPPLARVEKQGEGQW